RVPEISDSFLDAILAYDWPGNVRQLENLAERLALIHADETLRASHFRKLLHKRSARRDPQAAPTPPALAIDIEKPMAEALQPLVEKAEISYLEQTLSRTQGRITEAAAHAGINRRTLLRKMQKYGLNKQ